MPTDLGDFVQGSDGQWYDPRVPPPPGVTLNNTQQMPSPEAPPPRPTMTAEPPKPFEFATPQGGSLITTPNSSTGEPQIKSPSASQWQPSFQTNRNLTPLSRSGAPAAPPPNFNPMTMPGLPVGGPLMTGAAAVANAPRTPAEINASANKIGGFADSLPGISWLINHGYLSPSTNPMDDSAAPIAKTASQPQGVTVGGRQVGTSEPPPINLPPFNVPPPPPLPPFSRGPIPPYLGHPAHAGGAQAAPGGGGGPAAAAPPAAPQNVNLGYYRSTLGGARGTPTWIPGQYGNPATPPPQIYRGPQTVAAPGGAQNYYIPGSAPMATGDWTGPGQVAGGAPPPGAAPNQSAGGNARGYNVNQMFANLPNNTFDGALANPRMRAAAMQGRHPFTGYPFNGQNPGIEVGGA